MNTIKIDDKKLNSKKKSRLKIFLNIFKVKKWTQVKAQNLHITRYKTFDKYLTKLITLIGENNLIKIHNLAITKKISLLHLTTSLLLCRTKNLYETTEIIPLQLFNNIKSRYINYCLADWLLKHRDYSEKTESFFLKSHYRNKEVNVNLRYSDFISQKYGYRSEKLKRIASRLYSEVSFRNLTKSQKVRLSIILYQLNRDKGANKIIKNIGRNFLTKHTSSPYIFNKLIKHNIFNDPYIQRGNTQYLKILKARNEFIKSIISSAGEFCIVGNAPTEINSGNGPLIDSKKIVIRINNYSIAYPNDYGTKQDVWVRVTNNEISNIHLKSNSMVIFAANNFAIKRRDADKYLLPPYLMNKSYTVVPNHVYKALINKLDGLPSTGLAIAYWVYTLVGKFPKECLFGFTHFHKDRSFKEHYYDDENEIGVHLHEWDKERIIFEQITE